MSCIISSVFCFIGVAVLILLGIMFVPIGLDMFDDARLSDDTLMKVNSILGMIIITLLILGGIIVLSYTGIDIWIHPADYIKQ